MVPVVAGAGQAIVSVAVSGVQQLLDVCDHGPQPVVHENSRLSVTWPVVAGAGHATFRFSELAVQAHVLDVCDHGPQLPPGHVRFRVSVIVPVWKGGHATFRVSESGVQFTVHVLAVCVHAPHGPSGQVL